MVASIVFGLVVLGVFALLQLVKPGKSLFVAINRELVDCVTHSPAAPFIRMPSKRLNMLNARSSAAV